MAENREQVDSVFQNEPLTPDTPHPLPEGEVIGQTPKLAADDAAPLLDISTYPDTTGEVVETAYPGQDSAIDATADQSRAAEQ